MINSDDVEEWLEALLTDERANENDYAWFDRILAGVVDRLWESFRNGYDAHIHLLEQLESDKKPRRVRKPKKQ